MKLVLSFQDSLLDCLISIEHKLISKKWYSPIFAHNLEFAIFVAHSVFNLYCEHVSRCAFILADFIAKCNRNGILAMTSCEWQSHILQKKGMYK